MNDSRENRIPIDLIAKVLSGEADKPEEARLKHWESLSPENSTILSQYNKLWERSGDISPTDSVDINNEWEKFVSSRSSRKDTFKGIRSLKPVLKLAAAILAGVILSLSGLLTYNSIRFENVKAIATVTDIILPDGSNVALYPGSGIKYPKKFGPDKRDIKLEGEAFFDVARDSLRTFSVIAGDMRVKVLGTSFNVEAFKTSDTYSVIVEEGLVAVYNSNEKVSARLLPGDKASFSPSQNLITTSINSDVNFGAWRTGKIIFKDSRLEEVASTLSKVFLIDIEVVSESEDQLLTVTFDNRSLDYILETIKATLDITIDENEEKILIR